MTRSPARGEIALAIALLALGLLALMVATGQRLAAEITLARAESEARAAQDGLTEARSSLRTATERRDAAVASATEAEREAAAREQELSELQEVTRTTDHPGRLALAEQLVGLGAQQADRFAAMNDAALADDVATYNRLADDSNAFIQQNNDLWGQLTDTSGIDSDAPLV